MLSVTFKQIDHRERIYSAQQLAKLTKHSAMQDDPVWLGETLRFLLTTTLFEAREAVEPLERTPIPFSREAKKEVRGTFFKALDFKAKTLEQRCELLTKVMDQARSLLDKSVATSVEKLDGEAREAWRRLTRVTDDLVAKRKKKDGKGNKSLLVFQLLFTEMGFQLLVEPTATMELLDELHQCYEKSGSGGKGRRRSKAKKEDEEPHWAEVVVDLLISLQSQSKHELRQIAGSVFK